MTTNNIPVRGAILNRHKFHMYARVKEGVTKSDFTSNFSPGDFDELPSDISNLVFFLNTNQYLVGNEYFHRVYFSCDVEDLLVDPSHSSFNLGAAVMDTENFNSGKFSQINFRTIYKGSRSLPVFKKTIPERLEEISLSSENQETFSFSQKKFNLNSNFLYADVPYSITSETNLRTAGTTTSKHVFWSFRKVNKSTNSSNISFFNPGSSTTTSFVPGDVVQNTITGLTNLVDYTLSSTELLFLDLDSLPTADKETLEKFPLNGGIFKITLGAVSEVIIYNNIIAQKSSTNKHQLLFKLLKRDATDNNVTLASFTSITQDSRNNPSNFVEANTDLNDVLEFFVIPEAGDLFFPGKFTTTNLNRSAVTPVFNISVNSRKNGNDITTPFGRTSHGLQAYYYHNALSSVWTSNSSSVQGVARSDYNSKTGTGKITLFGYTNSHNASVKLMYRYCNKNETCGQCFGVASENGNGCLVKSNASISLALGQNITPMEEKELQGKGESPSKTAPASKLMFGFVITMIVFAVITVIFIIITGVIVFNGHHLREFLRNTINKIESYKQN